MKNSIPYMNGIACKYFVLYLKIPCNEMLVYFQLSQGQAWGCQGLPKKYGKILEFRSRMGGIGY